MFAFCFSCPYAKLFVFRIFLVCVATRSSKRKSLLGVRKEHLPRDRVHRRSARAAEGLAGRRHCKTNELCEYPERETHREGGSP